MNTSLSTKDSTSESHERNLYNYETIPEVFARVLTDDASRIITARSKPICCGFAKVLLPAWGVGYEEQREFYASKLHRILFNAKLSSGNGDNQLMFLNVSFEAEALPDSTGLAFDDGFSIRADILFQCDAEYQFALLSVIEEFARSSDFGDLYRYEDLFGYEIMEPNESRDFASRVQALQDQFRSDTDEATEGRDVFQ